MRRFTEDLGLTPDNDPSPAPFGAFTPNAAQAAIIRLAHRTRLKRGAFRPMLSRLVNLLRAGPVDVEYQGASFRFYHQASATERGALFNPAYNIEELDFLRAHAPSSGVFVDVGANVGTYALALAHHVGPGGKVIAIEPHPVTHARLAFNRSASGYTQVKLVPAAAGPSDGELMIDHIGFPVSDYQRAKAFYAKALAPLDYSLVMEVTQEQNDRQPAAGFGTDGKPDFWIGGEGGLEKPLHVAIVAKDRATVDAFH